MNDPQSSQQNMRPPDASVNIANMHSKDHQMTSEEREIHEFARDLWKTLHKIDVKTIADAHNEPIRGFSGKELVRHVKKHLKKHVKEQGLMGDKHVVTKCE